MNCGTSLRIGSTICTVHCTYKKKKMCGHSATAGEITMQHSSVYLYIAVLYKWQLFIVTIILSDYYEVNLVTYPWGLLLPSLSLL